MAFVAGNNPHILSHILGEWHLKSTPLPPQPKFVDHSTSSDLVRPGFSKQDLEDCTIPRGGDPTTAGTHTGQKEGRTTICFSH